MKITKNVYIILFIILFTLLALFLNYTKVIEGFSPEYKYLEKLPDNNTWSKSTIDAVKVVVKNVFEKLLKTTLTQEQLDNAIKILQQQASEEEALEYVKTGSWPWDDYVIKFVESLGPGPGMRMAKADIPFYKQINTNRATYLKYVAPFNVAELETVEKMNNGGYKSTDGTIICARGHMFAAVNGKGYDSTPSTDYSLFAKFIPKFKFTGEPYNICESTDKHPIKFEITGTTNPEAWDIFTGKILASAPVPVPPIGPVSANPINSVSSQKENVLNDFISVCSKAVKTM